MFGAILNNWGSLQPSWNHIGIVLGHLEQFFNHLEDIFKYDFEEPHGLKTDQTGIAVRAIF